jgi:Right handed beta helix region
MKTKTFFSFFLFPFSYFVLLFLFSFLLTWCSTGTESGKQVKFSGTVTLEGEADYSGVMVSLYRPVLLDTALVRINKEYPNIGVQISQETEFDHREQIAVDSTTTAADGSWEIKVEEGIYNVVVKKAGFGWRRAFSLNGSSKSNISLKKEIILKGIKSRGLDMPSNSFVVIDGTVEVTGGAGVNIQNGTIFEFINSGRLKIFSDVDFTGSDNNLIYLSTRNEGENAEIVIDGAVQCSLSFVVLNNIKKGIYIKDSGQITITSLRVKNSDTAIEFFDDDQALVSEVLISNSLAGINTNSTDLTVQKSIINNITGVGIEFSDTETSTIKKNYIGQCGGEALALNKQAFFTAKVITIVVNNNFESNFNDIFIGTNTLINANSNNFLKDRNLVVKTIGRTLSDTLDFTNNYWGTDSHAAISDKILDANDFGEDNAGRPVINFVPFATSKLSW